MKGQGDIDWNFAPGAFSPLVSHGAWQVIFQLPGGARCVWPIVYNNEGNKRTNSAHLIPHGRVTLQNWMYYVAFCCFKLSCFLSKGKCCSLTLLCLPHPGISLCPFVWSFTLLKWVNMLEIIFPSALHSFHHLPVPETLRASLPFVLGDQRPPSSAVKQRPSLCFHTVILQIHCESWCGDTPSNKQPETKSTSQSNRDLFNLGTAWYLRISGKDLGLILLLCPTPSFGVLSSGYSGP